MVVMARIQQTSDNITKAKKNKEIKTKKTKPETKKQTNKKTIKRNEK